MFGGSYCKHLFGSKICGAIEQKVMLDPTDVYKKKKYKKNYTLIIIMFCMPLCIPAPAVEEAQIDQIFLKSSLHTTNTDTDCNTGSDTNTDYLGR